MITEDQLEELPEDDLEAFIAFDALLREQFKFGCTQNMNGEREYAVYMLAFSEARNIDLDVNDEVPAKDSEFRPYFDRLISRVNVTKEKIRLAQAAQRKINGTTFRIATNFKAQIGGHLNAIRNIVRTTD